MALNPQIEWQFLSNVDKIMEYTTFYPSLTKWKILKYFCSLPMDNNYSKVALKLLNSKYFSDEELYHYFVNENHLLSSYSESASTEIIERITNIKPWENYTDLYEIQSSRNKYIKKQDEDLQKVEYFMVNNEKIFRQLTNNKMNSLLFDKLSKNNLQNVPDYLYEYLGSQMTSILSTIQAMNKRQFTIEDYIKQNKDTIVKCCIASPENSYATFRLLILTNSITLDKLMKNYSSEQLNKLPKVIKRVLIHPDETWKLHTNPELIGYRTPKGKEWEVLEYFAKNKPEIFVGLVNPKTNYKLYQKVKVVEHYKDANFSTLPPALQEYIRKSRAELTEEANLIRQNEQAKQDLLNYQKTNWLNSNGELIKFFRLADNFPITSKEDYLLIANIFRESGLSAMKFCYQYQIDNVEGFRQMLLKVSEEDAEFKAFYEKFSNKQQQEFLSSCVETINNVLNDNITVEEMIQNHIDIKDFKRLTSVASSIFEEKDILTFIKKIVKYYAKKLSACGNYSADIDSINNLLSFKDILFFTDNSALDKFNRGSNVNLFEEFINCLGEFKSIILRDLNKEMFDKKSGIKTTIKHYESKFVYGEFANGRTSFSLSDGTQAETTNDMIDEAYSYLWKNKLFKCKFSMSKLIKAIAEGTLEYQQETKDLREQLEQKVLSQIKECSTIEEYFESKKSNQFQ